MIKQKDLNRESFQRQVEELGYTLTKVDMATAFIAYRELRKTKPLEG